MGQGMLWVWGDLVGLGSPWGWESCEFGDAVGLGRDMLLFCGDAKGLGRPYGSGVTVGLGTV